MRTKYVIIVLFLLANSDNYGQKESTDHHAQIIDSLSIVDVFGNLNKRVLISMDSSLFRDSSTFQIKNVQKIPQNSNGHFTLGYIAWFHGSDFNTNSNFKSWIYEIRFFKTSFLKELLGITYKGHSYIQYEVIESHEKLYYYHISGFDKTLVFSENR